MNRKPTADELSNGTASKASRVAALTEARDLAHWAGCRIPNGPCAGMFMHGYHLGIPEERDLAIAMIVARVRSEAVADFVTRNSVSHVARIKPGVMVAGSVMKDNEYSRAGLQALYGKEFVGGDNGPKETRRERSARQFAVRKTGKCDNCGAEFVDDAPAFAPGPAKRTRKQWREAFASLKKPTPAQVRARKARGVPKNTPLMDALQPEAAAFGRDWSGPDQSIPTRKRKAGRVSKTNIPSGLVPTYSMGRVAAAKEKIPNHKDRPTGKRPKPSKRKRK